MDTVIRQATGFLLQVLAGTDIFFLVMCLFFQTYYSIVTYTDWSPALQYYYAYMDPYIWPLASITQTCEVWIVVLGETKNVIFRIMNEASN